MKIIIDNQSNHSDAAALLYVSHVIGEGRVSNLGKQYCYVTTWKDGTIVYADKNKKSDKFIVTNNNRD